MTIEAINEQLLRAIGVAVALLDGETLKFSFHNDTFEEWFGTPDEDASLLGTFDALNVDELRENLASSGRYTVETKFKQKRRTMVIALDFTATREGEQEIAVLVCQNITRIKELESMIDSYSIMVERNTREIKREKEQVEKLLLNVMPRSAYEEFKMFGVVTPKTYDPVSVLMVEFAGFNQLLETVDPGVIVTELNDIYSAFDKIAEQFGCERIKTVGNSYVAVSGLPDPTPDHVNAIASTAIRFIRYLERRNTSHPNQWQCRIGVATGTVIGSVVGIQKYVYDVFGPAVSLAAKLREVSDPMQISVHEAAASILKERFELSPAGELEANGFPRQPVWLLGEEKTA